jgi:hypothetical protein
MSYTRYITAYSLLSCTNSILHFTQGIGGGKGGGFGDFLNDLDDLTDLIENDQEGGKKKKIKRKRIFLDDDGDVSLIMCRYCLLKCWFVFYCDLFIL